MQARKQLSNPRPWEGEPSHLSLRPTRALPFGWTLTWLRWHILVLRGPVGAWNGYVGVPRGHRLHGVDYSDCLKQEPPRTLLGTLHGFVRILRGEWPLQCRAEHPHHCDHSPEALFRVHGGLTFAGDWDPDIEPRAEAGRWYFGFDTAHYCDRVPAYDVIGRADVGTYRTADYVREQAVELFQQLRRFSWWTPLKEDA